jgi:hypothetical protein
MPGKKRGQELIDVEHAIQHIFPNARVDEDHRGELVIHTNLFSEFEDPFHHGPVLFHEFSDLDHDRRKQIAITR